MIEEIDAFGRDTTPNYDDLVKVRLATAFVYGMQEWGRTSTSVCVPSEQASAHKVLTRTFILTTCRRCLLTRAAVQ